MCTVAGIPGFQINLSFRVSSATIINGEGMDEKLIMEHTGHGITGGAVGPNKRTTNAQQQVVKKTKTTKPTSTQHTTSGVTPMVHALQHKLYNPCHNWPFTWKRILHSLHHLLSLKKAMRKVT